MIKVTRFNERIPLAFLARLTGNRAHEGEEAEEGFLDSWRAATNQVVHKSRPCFANRIVGACVYVCVHAGTLRGNEERERRYRRNAIISRRKTPESCRVRVAPVDLICNVTPSHTVTTTLITPHEFGNERVT